MESENERAANILGFKIQNTEDILLPIFPGQERLRKAKLYLKIVMLFLFQDITF